MQIRRRVTLETERPGLLSLVALVAIVVVDQVSKAVVRTVMTQGQSIELWEGVFDITYVRNEGAAYGLFPGRQSIFILTGIVVLIGIAVFWWLRRPRSAWLALSLGLVGAGALGNLIDRALPPHLVTDFIDVFGRHFPVFNVADSSIFVGVAMLMVWILFVPESGEEHESSEKPPLPAPDDTAEADTATPEPQLPDRLEPVEEDLS